MIESAPAGALYDSGHRFCAVVHCIFRTWIIFPISKLEIMELQWTYARTRRCASPQTRHPEWAAGALEKPGGEPIHLSFRGIEGSEALCGFRLALSVQWRETSKPICAHGVSGAWIEVCLSTRKGTSRSRRSNRRCGGTAQIALTGGWRASRGLAVCSRKGSGNVPCPAIQGCAQSRIARSKVLWRSRSLRCNSQRKNAGTKPCGRTSRKGDQCQIRICAC